MQNAKCKISLAIAQQKHPPQKKNSAKGEKWYIYNY